MSITQQVRFKSALYMKVTVGFGFVTWPQNSSHLEVGMLMTFVGM